MKLTQNEKELLIESLEQLHDIYLDSDTDEAKEAMEKIEMLKCKIAGEKHIPIIKEAQK